MATARKATSILLRIPSHIKRQLDTVLKARPVKIPRHAWILEAISRKAGARAAKSPDPCGRMTSS